MVKIVPAVIGVAVLPPWPSRFWLLTGLPRLTAIPWPRARHRGTLASCSRTSASRRTATVVEIAGWFIPSGRSRRVIVLVHGKDANRTRELDRDLSDDVPGEFPDLAVGLSRRGFAVLMIDLRGHGQSGHARFGFGHTERRDVRGAVDWLVARGFCPGRIGVLGISMGAAAGIGAASEDDRIGAFVADSSFAELDAFGRDALDVRDTSSPRSFSR